jgi:hypothetical protein
MTMMPKWADNKVKARYHIFEKNNIFLCHLFCGVLCEVSGENLSNFACFGVSSASKPIYRFWDKNA